MTLQTRREAGTGARPPADPSSAPSTSRWTTWRASWAVALRMARRDVRRHRGRSGLVLLMVGVPTLLLVFGLTFAATAQITGVERIPYEIGSGQAWVGPPSSTVAVQTPDADGGGGSETAATPIPGYAEGAPLGERTAAIGALLHGTALPIDETAVRVRLAPRSAPRMSVLVADGRFGYGDLLRLTSGRWPTSDTEVLVTDAGVKSGLPRSGTMTVATGERTTTVTVVGTASTTTAKDVVSLSHFGLPDESTRWVIKRSTPVRWDEVRRLNAYGLTVLSADVLRHPPSLDQLDPQLRDWASQSAQGQRTLAVAGGTVLLLVTTLLVGPAFAVSAARQRRTLALAASNGATTGQLRRTVLAQALVLGVLAAGIGAVLGILAVPVMTRGALPHVTDFAAGPLDIPWLPLLGVTAIAMLSAVIAALVPASRLGRLDIIGVMKGQNVSPPVSKVLPVLGLVLAVGGGAVLFQSVVSHAREIPIVAGGVALILGTLFLVPLALVLVSRLAHHLPVPLRMAARDAARQRSRSAPAVAAVVGAIAALTMMLVGLASDTTQQAREYTPSGPSGEGVVHAMYVDGGSDPAKMAAAELRSMAESLRQAAPTLSTARLDVSEGLYTTDSSAATPWVATVPAGCTPEQTVSGDADVDPRTGQPRCAGFGSNQFKMVGSLPLGEIERRFALDAAQGRVLADGGAVLLVGEHASVPASVTLAHGTSRVDGATGAIKDLTVAGSTTVPVIGLRATPDLLVRMPEQAGLLVTDRTADRLGWRLTPTALVVHDPAGAIDTATEDKVNAALGDEGELRVERGFQRVDRIVIAVIVGVFAFLLLVITLTSTALSMAEQQNDQATLAAVGATRRTRRAMAAAQALVLCGIGAVLGFAVGLVPGIAVAHPLTDNAGMGSCDTLTGFCSDAGQQSSAAIVTIPWLPLMVAVVGVPLLAAAFSWLAVRRAPAMTRRAT